MWNKLKKFWPSFLHAAATTVLFMDPAVSKFALGHPAYAAPIVLGWGFLLHWAQSPKETPASKF